MPLPSGTSISADDINSHLGRSAGSAVSWDTMIRTLSNNNSTPNLNDVRGRAPRHISYAINQTGTNSGFVNSLYYDSGLYDRINSHNIPNSPWRVVLHSLRENGSGNNYIEMRVLGTGTSYGTVYRYVIPTTVGPFGTAPGGYAVNLTPTYLSGMLSNGKLVIVFAASQNPNSPFAGMALGIITITFNTDGSCAGYKVYVTDLNGNYGNSGNIFFYDIYTYGNLHLSVNGNSFAFPTYHNGTYRHNVVKVDASTDTLSVKYAFIASTSDVNADTGINAGYQYTCKTILQSNGDVTVVKTPATTDYTTPLMVNKLADAGGWSTYSNTRWGTYDSKYYLPYSGGANYNITTAPSSQVYHRAVHIDRLNYYYIIQWQTNVYINSNVASAWYFTGDVTTLTIQKIRSSDNTSICKFGLTADGYLYGTAYYDSKYGWQYSLYEHHPLGRRSVIAIESDSSGNTYVIYKTYYVANGGSQSSPSLVADVYTLPAPATAQMLFHFSKFDTSGNHVWTRILDVGPKQAALMPYTSSVLGSDTTGANMPESMSILLREEINIVEVYASGLVRNTGTTNYYDVNSNLRSSRTLHINMTTGDTLTSSDSNASVLNVQNNFTSSTSYTVKNNAGNNQTMTLIPVQKFTISTNNAVTNTNVFSGNGLWTSVSLSSIATGNPTLNGNPNTGSTYGGYTP